MNLARIQAMMQELKGWSFETNALVKEYEFKDFKEALIFLNKVGDVSERHNHHPMILLNYNRLKLTLTTHSENQITEKDFALAKDIDGID